MAQAEKIELLSRNGDTLLGLSWKTNNSRANVIIMEGIYALTPSLVACFDHRNLIAKTAVFHQVSIRHASDRNESLSLIKTDCPLIF